MNGHIPPDPTENAELWGRRSAKDMPIGRNSTKPDNRACAYYYQHIFSSHIFRRYYSQLGCQKHVEKHVVELSFPFFVLVGLVVKSSLNRVPCSAPSFHRVVLDAACPFTKRRSYFDFLPREYVRF